MRFNLSPPQLKELGKLAKTARTCRCRPGHRPGRPGPHCLGCGRVHRAEWLSRVKVGRY